jgi:hypothetical protein
VKAKTLILIVFIAFCFCSLLYGQITNRDSLLSVIKSATADSSRVKAMNAMAGFYTASNPDSAMLYANRGFQLAKSVNYLRGEGGALWHKTNISLLVRQPDSAIKYGRELLDYAVSSKRDIAQFSSNSMLGRAYNDKGIFSEGLKYNMAALKAAEKTGKPRILAAAHQALGVSHVYVKNIKFALAEYDIADSIIQTLHDTIALISLWYVKGNVYMSIDPKKAIDYHTKRIKLCEQKKLYDGVAAGYSELAQLMHNERSYQKALDYSMKAYEILKVSGDEESIGNTITKILDAMRALKRFGEMLPYIDRLAQIGTRTNNLLVLEKAYGHYDLYYEYAGDYKKALSYYKRLKTLHDSVYDDNFSHQVADMSKKYETEKKDKELLKKDSEIKIQQAEARQASTQRNLFIAGFALMFISTFLILRGYNQKRKANVEINRQKQEVEKQKQLVEDKQQEILDSIHYAKRIQHSLITSDKYIEKALGRLKENNRKA